MEVSGIFALVCTVGGWVGGHDDVLLQIFIVMDARCSSSWCCLHGENAKLQKLLCECCDFWHPELNYARCTNCSALPVLSALQVANRTNFSFIAISGQLFQVRVSGMYLSFPASHVWSSSVPFCFPMRTVCVRQRRTHARGRLPVSQTVKNYFVISDTLLGPASTFGTWCG